MKFIPSQIIYFTQSRTTKRNLKLLLNFMVVLALLIVIYSVLFHYIMQMEGNEFSWLTGFYWTLTVMSTLGFGDITFASDLGRAFSMVVLLSGILFLLVMLPFTFIQFFYGPWLEAQSRAKTPRELPEDTQGHVILTNFDPLTINLIEKFKLYNINYAVLAPDLQRALELYDMNYNVVRGELGDPETYKRLRIQNAAMLVATNDDMTNTNISFTVRETIKTIPIITNADADNSIDILQLAGSTHVFQFMKMLGESLARRTMGMNMGANIIGEFDKLLIAEAPAMRTPLEGKTILESRLREKTGITIVGLWERGQFELPNPRTPINPTTVLVLAGTVEQLNKYDEEFSAYRQYRDPDIPVIILGGGRVGLAAARTLKERQINYKIVEKRPQKNMDDTFILGNAADLDTLNQAGIQKASSVIITTHDDSMNIYLTIYCRKLRSDLQIVSRANLDGNISKLHSAGADLVMSHASMGANTIINLLKPNKILMIAEGLNIFGLPVPVSLAGKSLAESQIRRKTGCSVVAIRKSNKLDINPDPSIILETGLELVLIGTSDSEKAIMDLYKDKG